MIKTQTEKNNRGKFMYENDINSIILAQQR